EVTLNANTKNQKIIWKSEIQIHLKALQHSIQFSNDQKEARLDILGSLKGQSQYLENIFLPVYEKSLVDILKLGGTTNSGGRQYLHASTSLVYTKNPNGYAFLFPLQELADRFIIPGLKLNDLNSVLLTPLSTSPFVLNLPALPKVIFPKVDVLTKYSEPEGSSVPFFEITVPEGQLIVSQFTLPKRFPVGSTILDLNEITNKIADFDLPTITLPEQTIEIPSFKFSVPAGIFIPFFGALAARLGIVSPLYNATWSAGLKNKEDHVETFLDSTCSSTLQFLEYDLNVVGTHKIDDGMLISKTKGILAHHDFSAEYNEDGKYKDIWNWHGEAHLDITSPAFTEFHLHYQEDEGSLSSSAASPAIGTLGLDLSTDDNNINCNVYFQPQSSSDKKLSIFKTEWRYQKSNDQ
uniref:Apolipoprotein B n=1 Tax=Jaculus jaculus TaxID=51337 RepID=A0A8C5NVX9_JACJA